MCRTSLLFSSQMLSDEIRIGRGLHDNQADHGFVYAFGSSIGVDVDVSDGRPRGALGDPQRLRRAAAVEQVLPFWPMVSTTNIVAVPPAIDNHIHVGWGFRAADVHP